MRNIFVVNPFAGQKTGNDSFVEKINAASEAAGVPAEIYITKGVADAADFTDKTCRETSEEIRFFACGGDGTLNEVINGAYGHGNAVVGCIPIGTGNDFVRNFTGCGSFLDIEAQLRGTERIIDVIEYNGSLSGAVTKGCAVNMFNIGFDCNVVDMTARLKNYPLISGSMAYLLGVGVILIRKKGSCLRIETNGEVRHEGPLLLTTIANGSFCGGGVMSNPDALLDDGLFDVQIIQNMPRTTFVALFPKYSKGTHLGTAAAQKLIDYSTASNAVITAVGRPFMVSIDGELFHFDRMSLRSIKDAIRFSVPKAQE